MSLPPDGRRPLSGSGHDAGAPESSWLSDALPEGAWASQESSSLYHSAYQPAPDQAGPSAAPTQAQAWQPGPEPYQQAPASPPPYRPTGQPPWVQGPPRRRRAALVVGLSAGAVVLVGLIVGGAWLLGRDSGGDPSATSSTTSRQAAPPRTPETTTAVASGYEATRLADVERSVFGQLEKGDRLVVKPDLEDALTTPTTVGTVPCTDQHASQVVGFVDIADIADDAADATSYSQYTYRCLDLMDAEGVPEGLQGDPPTYFYPSPEERAAGVDAVMCLATTGQGGALWTGSVLDGTAAGY